MNLVGVLMLYLMVVGAVAHVPLIWWAYWRIMGRLLDATVKA